MLFDSNVDLATLPPDLQMKALHGGPVSAESHSQGRAKYDDLLSDGPLGTATSSRQSLDLETLSPKAQIRALTSANSPTNTQSQQQSLKKKDDGIKLGSNIGLDGSIHLLRSARQIIAERLARAHGVSPTVRRAAEAAIDPASHPQQQRTKAPSGLQAAGDRQQDKPSLSDASSSSSDEEEQRPAANSAEEKLAAEEARLRSSVADLERRAADTEVSDDQGLRGGPAPPSDV